MQQPSPLRITAIGADGDGIARRPDGTTAFIPFTLPGEQVDGSTVIDPSPERIEPACPHFGTCGGCSLQHWAEAPYLAWKAGLLQDALDRAGYPDAVLAPIVASPPGTRRRMDLAVKRQNGVLTLGFHQRRGPIVDLDVCPVLDPVLAGLIPRLRQMLRRLTALKREGSAIVNLLTSGPDILLRLDGTPSANDRILLADFANENGAPRIAIAEGSHATEPAAQRIPPVTMMSGVAVTAPPGAFLQASPLAEAAIVACVLAALPAKRTSKTRVAELYAGCGTLSFALEPHIRVDAFEGDGPALSALQAAANTAGLAGRIVAAKRDLTRQPLMAKELAAYPVVVLDPPFDGAAVQIAQIAVAKVPRVIYVSCNPAALARDARTLHGAGYKLLSATPIDQFLWSARLESVVVFGK